MYYTLLTLPFLFVSDAPASTKPDDVQFPTITHPISPSPTQITKLSAAQLYVITSDVPCYVLSSPQGLVTVYEQQGPVVVRGLFVDGTKVETRTYRQKQVFLIDATGKGTVELLVVILGKTRPQDVLRKTLEVDNGQGPRPPPDPPTPPPSDQFVTALQAAYIADGKPATQLPLLIAIFRKSPTIVNDPKMKTPYDVARTVHLSVAGILEEPDEKITTKMPNVRKAIGSELDKVLPTGPASAVNLDSTLRTTIAAQYLRVQKALEGVTP